jgi:ribosome maturation factor RimP
VKWAFAHFFVWAHGIPVTDLSHSGIGKGSQAGQTRPVAEAVSEIAAPIARALALEVVEVECVGQGSRMVVRVFIDKPGGVTVADCEQMHRSLGHALDVRDPIPHAYTLEVSSPGLDRPLKRRVDFERALGQRVSVKLKQADDGQWRIGGRLIAVDDAGLTLAIGRGKQQTTRDLTWEVIATVRLDVGF